jgi:hypothetical protein
MTEQMVCPHCRHCAIGCFEVHYQPCINCIKHQGEDMTGMKLNKKNDEVAGDNPEVPVDRVKILVSEATTSTHTETVVDRTAVIDRTTEHSRTFSDTELKMHAMNYAMNNTYVVERMFDKADGGAKPDEYAKAMIVMADQYLEWLKA